MLSLGNGFKMVIKCNFFAIIGRGFCYQWQRENHKSHEIANTIKETEDLRGFPLQNQLTRYLNHYHSKLYNNGKVMKCTIRQYYFVLAWSNYKPNEARKLQMDDLYLSELIGN